MTTDEMDAQCLRCLANTEGPGVIKNRHWGVIPLGGTPDGVWVGRATLDRLGGRGLLTEKEGFFELTQSGEAEAAKLLGREPKQAAPPPDEEF